MTASQLLKLGAAALVVSVAGAFGLATAQADTRLKKDLTSEGRTIAQLQTRIATLEKQSGSQPDWPAVAAQVEASVVVIATSHSLGSAWVASSDSRGSDLVTNYHVIADAWSSGTAKVDVRRDDHILAGTIVRVDPALSLIHI